MTPLPSTPRAYSTVEQRLRIMGELSLAPGTRKRYKAYLSTFLNIMGAQGEYLPPMEHSVQSFVLFAKEQGSVATWQL